MDRPGNQSSVPLESGRRFRRLKDCGFSLPWAFSDSFQAKFHSIDPLLNYSRGYNNIHLPMEAAFRKAHFA
ncbi:hypothetical protein TNCV_3248241 [Trichonephila clavipes]|nr:hypothetical protein TNCV_3248241 [Trichonephila clavipes]